MSQINYEELVKAVYPDAYEVDEYANHSGIPCGMSIVRYGRLFGLLNPLVRVILGYGYMQHIAWENAYETLVKQNKIIK